MFPSPNCCTSTKEIDKVLDRRTCTAAAGPASMRSATSATTAQASQTDKRTDIQTDGQRRLIDMHFSTVDRYALSYVKAIIQWQVATEFLLRYVMRVWLLRCCNHLQILSISVNKIK